MTVRRLRASASARVSIHPVDILPGRLCAVEEMLLQLAGLLGRLGQSAGVAGHPTLLQELLRVEGVEGAEVVDDVDELGKDGLVLGVLRNEDVLQHRLQLRLHLLYKLRVPQTGAI